jgi:hypothetical protein
MQGPAETLNYMLMGFAVILGVLGLYVLSIAVRYRNLRRDQEFLDALEEKEGSPSESD